MALGVDSSETRNKSSCCPCELRGQRHGPVGRRETRVLSERATSCELTGRSSCRCGRYYSSAPSTSTSTDSTTAQCGAVTSPRSSKRLLPLQLQFLLTGFLRQPPPLTAALTASYSRHKLLLLSIIIIMMIIITIIIIISVICMYYSNMRITSSYSHHIPNCS